MRATRLLTLKGGAVQGGGAGRGGGAVHNNGNWHHNTPVNRLTDRQV